MKSGGICMVGCTKLSSMIHQLTDDSMDCKILVDLQFYPLNSEKGHINGSIESRWERSDPLYCERLDLSSTYNFFEARQSIWRMDLEIIMVPISNTFSCVFPGLQLFHVKKQPELLPSMSLVMLVIIILGHMIPLVLNFEALFLQSHTQLSVLLRRGGWIKVKEVIVGLLTMVVFLFLFHLLQLTWSSRLTDEDKYGFWVAERNSLCVSLPLYTSSCLIALFLNWRKKEYGIMLHVSYLIAYQQHSHWQDLRPYASIVLDGFLFPQILLNMLMNSRKKVLSHSFYIGITFVRLLPHAYDLHRAHNDKHSFVGSYVYAILCADFYSTAGDAIILCGGVLFSVFIFLQQRFGGHFILPKRLKELETYEKVPVVCGE